MTGQEERDILFAQLFGFLSIIQSGLAVRTKQVSTSASSSTVSSSAESYENIISRLVELGEKKSWLRESAWFAISLAVDALHESEVEWQDDAVSKALDILFQTNSFWSTEKLALVLKLQNYYPKCDWKVLLAPTFKNIDILNTGNLPTISRILKVGIPQPSLISMFDLGFRNQLQMRMESRTQAKPLVGCGSLS
jgi:DNA polymerase phi